MALAAMRWTRVSIHKVVLAWLRAERETHVAKALVAFPEPVWSLGLSNLLDRPNLNDPDENRARLRLLYMIRNLFLVEIPPDTEWHEVHTLTHTELPELRTVNYQHWNDPNDKNELPKVAARKKLPLRVAPSSWERPILWGHDRNGPFTIIEGNNRLTAYAASGQSGLNIPAFIGLSTMRCVWHLSDNSGFLIQDLILRQ